MDQRRRRVRERFRRGVKQLSTSRAREALVRAIKDAGRAGATRTEMRRVLRSTCASADTSGPS